MSLAVIFLGWHLFTTRSFRFRGTHKGTATAGEELTKLRTAQSMSTREGKRQIKWLQRNWRGHSTQPWVTPTVTTPRQTPSLSKRTQKQTVIPNLSHSDTFSQEGDGRAKNSLLQFIQFMQKTHSNYGPICNLAKWPTVMPSLKNEYLSFCVDRRKVSREREERIKIMLSWFTTNRCLYWFPFYWSCPSFSVVNILTYFW